MERILQRRRTLLATLLVAALVSLVLASVARHAPMWGVHAAADALLAGYIGFLIHLRNASAEREMAAHAVRGS